MSSRRTSRYDAFVSFRGLDVRERFVDHLYSAFKRKKVRAFKDDVDMIRGESVKEGIQHGIKNSRVYVFVLTENYASSTWCLDELVEIKQSSGNGEKKMILPVFYGMLPKDVTSCFKGDFDRHKEEYTYERVDGWLQAVSWIVGISGWVFMNDWSEASLVASIARTIRRKVHSLAPIPSNVRLQRPHSLLGTRKSKKKKKKIHFCRSKTKDNNVPGNLLCSVS
ncbi:Toll/interleukin-1 receptor-like protein [Linum perenne]